MLKRIAMVSGLVFGAGFAALAVGIDYSLVANITGLAFVSAVLAGAAHYGTQ